MTEADPRHDRPGVRDAGDDAQALLAQRDAALRDLAQARERFQFTEQRLRRIIAWTEQVAADRLTLLRAERQLRLEAEARLAAVMSSTSWSLTAPLRALVAKLAGLRRR